MIDLKPYFDAARASTDEVNRIMAEMDAAFKEGSEEGKNKALALRPELDAAKAEAEETNALYLSMRGGAGFSDGVARNFVPVDGGGGSGAGPEKKSLTRAEFTALNPADRMVFVKAGGRLED